MHVVASQEGRRSALDRAGRRPLTVCGGPRHHRVALGERVLSRGQPARSGQLPADQPRIGILGRPRRPEDESGELARTGPVLGRPRAHDVTPRGGVGAVALASARVVRDRLTPAIPDLHARRDQFALALLDLTTTRGEFPRQLRGELLDLRHPIAHRPPLHPRQTLTHRRAQMRLIEEPGRLGVPVDRGGIKRRPPAVSAAGHVRRHHMGVQLRILRATHPVAIGGRHEPLPRLVAHAAAAATHPTRLALQIAQRRIDRRLVRLYQRPGQRRLPDREQHTHGLGRRERQVKRRHLGAATDALQALTRARVAAVHQCHEAVVVDLAAEPERLGPSTGPRPGHSPRPEE